MYVIGTAMERGTGRAIPGLVVQAWAPSTPPREGQPLAAAATDASGSFRFEVPSATSGGGGGGGDFPDTMAQEAVRTTTAGSTLAFAPTPIGGGYGADVADVLLRSWVGTRLVGALETRLVGRSYYDRYGGETSATAHVTLYLDDPFGANHRFFGRALTDLREPLPSLLLRAYDVGGSGELEVTTDPGGRFILVYPTGKQPAQLSLWLRRGIETWVARVSVAWTEESIERDVVLSPAGPCQVSGRAVERATGVGPVGIAIELLDGDQRWSNPVATAETVAGGAFSLAFERLRTDPPRAILRAYRRGELVGTAEPHDVTWNDGVLKGITVEVEPASPLPTVYRLLGQALDRATRQGLPGLAVEAWAPDFTAMIRSATTGLGGGFELSLPAVVPGSPPSFRTRFYRDGQLIAQPATLAITWSPTGEGTTFVDIDAPPPAPKAFRLSGRIVDTRSRAGIFGLRVEAWDRAPRDGGVVGVATNSAVDGSFTMTFPRPQDPLVVGGQLVGRDPAVSAAGTPPDLFVRVFADERLLATIAADVDWTPEGMGVTVLEILAPTVAPSSEVGLHELGESIASTVDHVQNEFARYPMTMGAFVLDEIDLEIPVEMRVDEIGQIRTRVVDATSANEAIGRVRMRVKPVLGASGPPADLSDQPLSVFAELSDPAIAKLAGERIYSVSDLARAARSGGGRAALTSLDLGVDLDVLLGKAMLLALPVLPRAVREGLLKVGIENPEGFTSHAAPATLATELSEWLGQSVGEDDVKAWQARTRQFLAVPLPTSEH